MICFSGPDGSGKSTLAKMLAQELMGKKLKVHISWMRGTHTLASLLARLLSRFNTFKGSDNPYYQIRTPKNFRRLWQLIEFISFIPILLIRAIIPSWLGQLVIAERYIPDFLMWVSLTTKDSNYLRSLNAKLLLALVLKAKSKIYVTAEYTSLLGEAARIPNLSRNSLYSMNY